MRQQRERAVLVRGGFDPRQFDEFGSGSVPICTGAPAPQRSAARSAGIVVVVVADSAVVDGAPVAGSVVSSSSSSLLQAASPRNAARATATAMTAWGFTVEVDPAVAVDDLADEPGVVAGGPHDVDRVQRRRRRGTTASMPSPRLNTCAISSSETRARALDLGEDPRLVPRAAPHDRVAVVGEHAHEVAGDAAAGDVRERVHRRPSPASSSIAGA